MSHVSPFRASATGHGTAPLGGPFERPGSRARSRRRSLIRAAVQHANGAVAPDGPVLSCRRGARLICNVGRTDKTKNTDHSDEKQIASGCSAHRGRLHHVGVRFVRRGFPERRRSVWIVFERRCPLGGPSRRRGHISLLRLEAVRTCRRPARTSWLSRAAARQRRPSRRSGTVDAAGLFNAGAINRSRVSVTRVVGLVSNGALRSPAQVAASVASPSRRLAADPTRRGLFAPVVSGRAHSALRVIRRFAENGPSVFTRHGVRLAAGGVTTRHLAGNSNVPALSNVVVGDRSFDQPSNTQMEPTR